MVQVKPHLLRDILTFLSPLKNSSLSGHSSYFSWQLNGELKKGGTDCHCHQQTIFSFLSASKKKVTLKDQAKGMPENFNVLIHLGSIDISACSRRDRKS